jgi:hypothetical protein
MANTRCYDSFNTILSASELSAQKRKNSIFTEVKKNVANLNTANPVKHNGYQYNQNTHINPTCDISSGKVAFGNSYDILNAYKAGAKNTYPVQVSTPKYETWCGNLYSINYSAHDISNVVQNDASFLNIVVDPSYLLFYDKCLFNYPERSRPETWTAAVDLSFQDTYFARAANNSLHVCD